LALFPIYLAGTFTNVITPGARVGGEPVRAYYMSRIFGGEKTKHFGIIVADKVGNALVFLLFLLASVVYALVSVPLGTAPKLVFGGVILFVVLVIVSGALLHRHVGANSAFWQRVLHHLYHGVLPDLLRRKFPTYQHFEEYSIHKLDNVFGPLGRTAGSPWVVAKVMSVAGLSHVFLFAAHYALFQALGIDAGPMAVVVIVTVSTLVGDISVAPGGAGFMDAGMIALCAAFRVGTDAAAAVTLLSRGVFCIYGLGLGGLCLAALALRYGKAPTAEPEAPVPTADEG
jgi:uncharacterized protein (TIRG00374 family)